MRISYRYLVLSLVAAQLASLSAAAEASPPPSHVVAEAERRNDRASLLYRQGRFEDALRLYQAAYDLSPDPRFLFNIGLAREKVFDFEQCALAFEAVIGDERVTGEVRAQARVRLASCRDRAKIAVLFTSAPPNAAVSIVEGDDARLVGRTPMTLELSPRSYTVRMELDGYRPRSDALVVDLGTRPKVDFVLEKLSSLQVEVDPAGAKVKIGELPWEAAPIRREVVAGLYTVRVERAGYEPVSREVRIAAGQEVSLVLPLRHVIPTRKVELRAGRHLGEMHLRIDGDPIPLPRPGNLQLRAGPHRVQARAPGHLPLDAEVVIPQERDVALELTLAATRTPIERTALWTVAGSALAFAGGGAYFGGLALRDQAELGRAPSPALRDRGEDRAAYADWAFTTAAVLGGATIVYYFITKPGSSRAQVAYE